MKIVHVIDYYQPRLGYQETFLAREHMRSGHEVCVVTSDRYSRMVYAGSDAAEFLGSRRKKPGLFTEEGIYVWRLEVALELPNIVWLRGLERKIIELAPDVVIVHGVTNVSAVRLARLKRKNGGFRLIYDDHAIPDNTAGWMRIFYPPFRWFFSPGIQRGADAFLAILPETRRFMNRKYGIPYERITVVPLGADTELFRYDVSARQALRRELDIPEGHVVFIYTGKIIPERQLPVLIDAAKATMRMYDNIRVMVVGRSTPAYLEHLKSLVDKDDLEDRFIWHDAVPNDELFRFYSAADVAVWPFGASIGMREAMACGLPLIIGRDAKVSELVEANNGLLFREGDAVDLAQQMTRLLEPGIRHEMGWNSRRLAEKKYSWPGIAARFLEAAG